MCDIIGTIQRGIIMESRKKVPYRMYLGNLLTFHDGVGTVSDIKYVIVREKSNLFAKSKYFAFPSGEEILVGNYEIHKDDEDASFLINAVRLSDIVGYKKIGTKKVCDILVENNDVKQLQKSLISK